MKRSRVAVPVTAGVLALLIAGCGQSSSQTPGDHDSGIPDAVVPVSAVPWSVRMADSVIMRNPSPLTIDAPRSPSWNYTQGLVFTAMAALGRRSQDQKYADYVNAYYDGIVDAQGRIGGGYTIEEYSLDRINAGKALISVYEKTGMEKYRLALQTLREQLRTHPRTSEGGFWHKNRYQYQMWLDGLYMGAAFLGQYGTVFGDSDAVGDAALQFLLMERHARDAGTGLLYHGWDESLKESWSNPQTGTSPSFWARGMGWFAMALVDTLDFLPPSDARRGDLVTMLDHLASAIAAYQDPTSAVWYQVLDQGARAGNYRESSASCMFTYALLKGVRLGYLDGKYEAVGRRAYEGIVKEFVETAPSGEVRINRACGTAGLGPDPVSGRYRDGSFAYYVGEPIADNDTKAVGSFILASLEYEARP